MKGKLTQTIKPPENVAVRPREATATIKTPSIKQRETGGNWMVQAILRFHGNCLSTADSIGSVPPLREF